MFNTSEILKTAHRTARKLGGAFKSSQLLTYAQRLSIGLKQAWASAKASMKINNEIDSEYFFSSMV